MRIQLSDHFNYKKLFRFVLPTIAMMVFTSIYGVIDGLFISNFVGKNPFSAVNLIMPFLMILGAVGFMIGTGGSAIISRVLGEKDSIRANQYFSLLVYTTLLLGVILAVVGELIVPYVATWLKADEELYDYCVLYARIVLVGMPFFMLQQVFQPFLTTAEKPKLAFLVTLIAGCTNIALDALFVAGLKWGVKGAAIATIISQMIGGTIPFIYFFSKNNSLLHLGKTKWYGKMLLKTCTNGSSEFVSNISGSVVSIVFNLQLLKYAGNDGIAAYGTMMYVNFIYVAIFIGYSIGTAPLIGYNFGAQNHHELKNIFKKSMIIMGVFGILMTCLALALASPISLLFVGYDKQLLAMTKKAFFIFSFAFLFTGFSIFSSSLFTALNNGAISAIVSFLRSLVYQISCVFILPLIFGLNGIWLSMLFAEILSMLTAMGFVLLKRKKYHYA